MRIFVTGSEGFIGKHLTKYLAEHGHDVMGFDRKNGCDVLDIDDSMLTGYDCVIHLAAQTSVWNPDIELIEYDNIRSFIHIYQICKKLNTRFIYASSSCAVNVTSMYGLSKSFDDQFVKLYGGDVVGLRFHNVYGPNPRPDTLLGVCMNEDKILLWNDGENKRHFTWIGDVCESIERSLTISPGLYNVLNPTLNSTKEFVEEVCKYKPLTISYTNQKRPRDRSFQTVDQSLQNLLDDKHTDIQEGIKYCMVVL